MPKLIEELTTLASDNKSTASELLKKMRIATVRLQLEDIEEWVKHELEGYPDVNVIPHYRYIGGVPQSCHVHWGWRTLKLSGNEFNDTLASICMYSQGIATLEAIAENPGPYRLSYPTFVEQAFMPHMVAGVNKIGLCVDRSAVIGVIDAIKHRVLEWSLAMEKAGVVGEGMSFTLDEKEKAANVTYNVSMGDNSRFNQNSTDNSANVVNHGAVFGDLRAKVAAEVKNPEARAAIQETIHAMETQQQAGNKKGFMAAYGEFMQAAANHIQIIQPFLDPLGDILNAI